MKNRLPCLDPGKRKAPVDNNRAAVKSKWPAVVVKAAADLETVKRAVAERPVLLRSPDFPRSRKPAADLVAKVNKKVSLANPVPPVGPKHQPVLRGANSTNHPPSKSATPTPV